MGEFLTRVLIVDDDEINRIIVEKILSKHFPELEFAEDGLEAYEKISLKNIDIVLMDIHMPVMDGIETIKKIRNQEDTYFKELPVIAFTASILPNEIETVFDSGFDDYLPKPLNISKLIGKITSYTEGKTSSLIKKKRNSEELRLF